MARLCATFLRCARSTLVHTQIYLAMLCGMKWLCPAPAQPTESGILKHHSTGLRGSCRSSYDTPGGAPRVVPIVVMCTALVFVWSCGPCFLMRYGFVCYQFDWQTVVMSILCFFNLINSSVRRDTCQFLPACSECAAACVSCG